MDAGSVYYLMDNRGDEFLKIIKTIETTQQQLGDESDPAQIKQLQEYLNHSYKRLSALTHQNSIAERER